MTDSGRERRKRDGKYQAPLSQQVMGMLGAAVLVSLLAYLAYVGWYHTSPPDILVAADRVEQGNGGYVVWFTARNLGGETASRVSVRGTLTGKGTVEEARTVLDYVPARSEARGGLVFTEDPSALPLRLAVESFQLP